MGYRYAKFDKQRIIKEIRQTLKNRYEKQGYDYTFRTRNLGLPYCHGMMGKLINKHCKDLCYIIDRNSRTYLWKTTFNNNGGQRT
jgi:alpha-D-ribose 1-methylphosphonate 5-phosphate C-P lyase